MTSAKHPIWGMLYDSPKNHILPKPTVPMNTAAKKELNARMTEALENSILRAVRKHGEATVEMIAKSVTTHSPKYIGAVCNRLRFKGKLDYDFRKDDKRPRKYWRLVK